LPFQQQQQQQQQEEQQEIQIGIILRHEAMLDYHHV
jgi:hypothetical protein